MYLDELLNRAGLNHADLPQITVTGVRTDSRTIQPGELFVGLPGTQADGGSFWPQAAARGACAAVISDSLALDVPTPIPLIPVTDSATACARLAAAFYDFPTNKLRLVGVTGTNGKTTTSHIIEHLLQPKVGLIGTLYSRWPGQSTVAEHTTPFAPDLQRVFAQMVTAACPQAVMEVSSHALSQGRVRECHYQAAVFTNLTQDHLDYHHTLDEYFEAKALLFTPQYLQGRAIINSDDRYGLQLIARSTQPVWSYGLSATADIRAEEMTFSAQGMAGELITPLGKAKFQTPLVGQFNLYNLLGAVGAVLHLGVSLEEIVTGLATFSGVPGRMEKVSAPDSEVMVLVDYAHTPDGLENLLKATRPFTAQRLICVFGCGGDRDRTKRPLMGEIVSRLADVAVVTSDNPRTEDPQQILADVLTGMPKVPQVVEVDRRLAIQQAICLAQPGDVVAIAGKGHEDYQILGKTKFPFDDRVEARQALAERL